jgi:hypothetical protein
VVSLLRLSTTGGKHRIFAESQLKNREEKISSLELSLDTVSKVAENVGSETEIRGIS